MANSASVKQMYQEHPCPVDTDEFGRRVSRDLNDAQRRFYEKYISPNMLVMDAGCGTGAYTAALAKSFPDTRFIALDFSRPSLAIAETNYGQYAN